MNRRDRPCLEIHAITCNPRFPPRRGHYCGPQRAANITRRQIRLILCLTYALNVPILFQIAFWAYIMAGTDRTIELAGAALRDDARRARRRYRRYLAGRYDRDRLFRTVTPDVVGFEVYRLGAKRSALAGDPGFTASLIAALRRRLRYAAMAARRGTSRARVPG